MDKVGTNAGFAKLLIATALAVTVIFDAAGARAANPPAAIALAQRIKARIQPTLPADLMVAEVTLPAALATVKDPDVLVQITPITQPGQVSLFVTLRSGGR